MIALTVTAELASAPVVTTPLRFDGLLWAAWHARLSVQTGQDWPDPVPDAPLPLARVETPHGWWWAASAVAPTGPESMHHAHRRPAIGELLDWSAARSVNIAAGPDKALRIPHYRRIAMLSLTWTCVGDRAGVADLLGYVPGVGGQRTQGHGWVRRWTVGPAGPGLDAYRTDVRLRPLPVEAVDTLPDRVSRRMVPLRPPYYDRAAAVPCWVSL